MGFDQHMLGFEQMNIHRCFPCNKVKVRRSNSLPPSSRIRTAQRRGNALRSSEKPPEEALQPIKERKESLIHVYSIRVDIESPGNSGGKKGIV